MLVNRDWRVSVARWSSRFSRTPSCYAIKTFILMLWVAERFKPGVHAKDLSRSWPFTTRPDRRVNEKVCRGQTWNHHRVWTTWSNSRPSGTSDYVQNRQRPRNVRFDYGPASDAELTPSQKFRVASYIPVIDQFVVSLAHRLSAFEET